MSISDLVPGLQNQLAPDEAFGCYRHDPGFKNVTGYSATFFSRELQFISDTRPMYPMR